MRNSMIETIFGVGLILLGGLMLLERFGLFHGAAGLFWGVALLMGAVYFLYDFVRSPRLHWWAVIPGMTFLGMAGSAVIPRVFSGLGGGIFLGALGLAFIIVYLTDHARWWGLIPGGVLLTLAVIASLGRSNLVNSGSLFFVGLGLTFLLVALLPNPFGKMEWAYIPAVVLVLLGALLGSQATAGLAAYVWPVSLIIIGVVVLARFFMKKEP